MLKKVMLSTVLMAASMPLFAGTPHLDKREAHQRERIAQGVHSGELTHREARHLKHGERQLHRQERRAKADGDVTARERARLDHSADRMSKRIYRQKHDRQDR